MRRRILPAAIALLIASSLTLTSAPAGQYSTEAALIQLAFGEGKLSNGGRGVFFLAKYQGLDMFAPGEVLPMNGSPDAPRLYGGGIPAVTGNEGPARYIGCIAVTNKSGQLDGGCTLIDPSTANFDPLLESGSLSFSVRSSIPGFEVFASVVLRGTGQPRPVHILQPEVIYRDGTARRIEVTGAVFQSRTGTMLGSVRSEVIGGGAFVSVDKAEMSGGVGNLLTIDRTRPVCANNAPPDSTLCPKDP